MKRLFSGKKKELDTKYSSKVSIPQYLPSKNKPKLFELYDKTKYTELLQDIYKADIPDDIKEFLKIAATRHIVFNYAKIADYYAHSEPNIQRLIEQSGLVIIDTNDAIANGYMRLSKNIRKLLEANND